MSKNRDKNVELFLKTILAKMEKGIEEHGESTGGEIEEIEEELIDIVGWAFVRWERLQKIKNKKAFKITKHKPVKI